MAHVQGNAITRTQLFQVAPTAVVNNTIVRLPANGGVPVSTSSGFNSVEIVINLTTADKEAVGKSLALALYQTSAGVDTFIAGFPDNNLGDFPFSLPWTSYGKTYTLTEPDGTVVVDPDPAFVVNIASLQGQQVCVKYFAIGISTAGLTINGIG